MKNDLLMLQKGCLKLDPLPSMAATTSFAHLVSFPEDLTVPDNMTPPPRTSQVSIHHSLPLITKRSTFTRPIQTNQKNTTYFTLNLEKMKILDNKLNE